MLEQLFGNKSAEKVLLFLVHYGEGYARNISETFETSNFAIQKQLLKLEHAGILVSQLKGKTRVFTWNPRYPLLRELQALLKRALDLLPAEEERRYFRQRRRPRRSGKPL